LNPINHCANDHSVFLSFGLSFQFIRLKGKMLHLLFAFWTLAVVANLGDPQGDKRAADQSNPRAQYNTPDASP
jgi:hypothetical protein